MAVFTVLLVIGVAALATGHSPVLWSIEILASAYVVFAAWRVSKRSR